MAVRNERPSGWAERIRRLMTDLKLSQAALAAQVGVSPPTVSRWLQSRQEPTAESYIALGNLARPPNGVYFWERAGLETSGLPDPSFSRTLSSLRVHLKDFKLVSARKVSRIAGKANAVAIPLLDVTAYGDRIPPREDARLDEADIDAVLFAPVAWCPHPEHMISMRLAGDSMRPEINPGSILFVDTAVKDRGRLHQRIAVVAHRDLGFKVARFQRVGGCDLLISANHKYPPIDVGNASKWKIFGEVLWWISRDAAVEPGAVERAPSGSDEVREP
jgi:transcriptional regulator with XRE-family HTH domain